MFIGRRLEYKVATMAYKGKYDGTLALLSP